MAITNTLTGLIPVLYEAMDIVSRELVGFIPAVSRDSNVERAAKDETVRSPVAGDPEGEDITPGVTPPATGGSTHTYVDMTISKSRAWPITWTGEEQRGLKNGGQYRRLAVDRWAKGLRKAVNEVEADLATLYVKASRASGTAGTTPFATAGNLSDSAGVRRILDDNGVPQQDLQLVLGSSAMANMRGLQTVLFKVNEAGTDNMLREGIIPEGLHGFAVRNSAQIPSHTKGTGAGYLVNNVAGYDVGDTTIALDTGTGTVVAGDIVTFAGDTNKYIVKTALSGGSIVLQEPGLREALADNTAMTIGASYTGNLAFHRGAIQLATRFPERPEEGDQAIDSFPLVDPLSGLAFEVAIYPLYRAVRYEIALAWGYEMINPDLAAVLLG